MAGYYMNEAVIDLPERPFVDKTIHALETKLRSGGKLAVFVHRRAMEGGKALRELVDENVALNHRRLSAYAVLDDARADVGGLPGVVLRTRWRKDGAVLYQLQAHVAVEGKYMIFAVSGPFGEQTACDQTFEGILRTLRFRSA